MSGVRNAAICVCLLLGNCPAFATFDFALAFWRELGARETLTPPIGSTATNKLYVHAYIDGRPGNGLKVYARNAATNFQIGVISSSGFSEITLDGTNAYSFYLSPALSSSDTSPVFISNRLPVPGQYSWEVGFMAWSIDRAITFNTNYHGVFNSTGSNSCLDLSAPVTRSAAYYSAGTNYCQEPTTLGSFASAHGQSFVATGDRIVGAKVHLTTGTTQDVAFTAQIFEDGPGGNPIGPAVTSSLARDGHYAAAFACWRDYDVQVIPGNRYYLRISASNNLAVWREADVYSGGTYFENDEPRPEYDLEALILCADYRAVGAMGSMSGTVRDRNGNALRGVVVTARRFTLDPQPFYDITDTAGVYRIPKLPAQTYAVSGVANGYISMTQTGMVVKANSNTVVNFVLQNDETTGGFIVGRITDSDDAPLAGALVTAHPGAHMALTTADGNYALGFLPRTNYILAASKIGYSSEILPNLSIDVAQTNELNFSLRPELLRNGNFEHLWCGGTGTATNWTRYISYSNGASRFDERMTRLSGSHAQGVETFSGGNFDVGFYQQVSVLPGSNYTFSAWTTRSHSLTNPATTAESWVGIDPLGGTNGISESIVWSSSESSLDNWTHQGVSSTAISNLITVFLRCRGNGDMPGIRIAFDDAVLQGESAFPLAFYALAGYRRADLRWEPLPWASSYVVRHTTSLLTPFRVVASNIVATGYSDQVLQNEVVYYYTVSGVRDGREGLRSPWIAVTPTAHNVLIPVGSVWRYSDNGSDQGTAWRQTNYNDGAWPAGQAMFSFGECSTTAVNGGPNTNRYITTYFRHALYNPDGNDHADLVLRVARDDGVIVYLNGAEVFRNNMPATIVNYRTLAPTNVFGVAEFTFIETNLSAQLLKSGTNIVAAEVHLYSSQDGDMSFDLELIARRAELRIQRPGDLLVWPIYAGAFNLEWAPRLYPTNSWSTVSSVLETNTAFISTRIPPAETQRFYRLRRP